MCEICSPVQDPTHVHLQVAEVSQQLLLHQDQIHAPVLQRQETHAALKDGKRVQASSTFFRAT